MDVNDAVRAGLQARLDELVVLRGHAGAERSAECWLNVFPADRQTEGVHSLHI